MRRNKPASPSKATSANDTSNQAEASGGSTTSSGSSNSVVGAEDIQRLTSKNTSPSKGFNLAGQLYNPDSAYQEQLLLTEQGAIRQEQQPEEAATRLQTAPNRYSLARLSSYLSGASGMVSKGSNGDQVDGGEELLKQESVRASTKIVMKMSRNDNKDNENTNGGHPQNGNGAAGGGDDLESNSKSGASSKFCTKFRCILVLLMGLALSIATVLILISSGQPPNNDECKGYSLYNLPFPYLNNKLFATKTLYATTLNYLTKEPLYSTDGNPVSLSYYPPPTPAPRVNDTPPTTLQMQANFNYVPASIQKPPMFISDHSLKTLHEKLIKFNGCSLKQFHFYGRHAARFPNADGIEKMNRIIDEIKKRLDAPSQHTSTQPDAEKQTFTTIPAATPSSSRRKDAGSKPDPECYDPMARLRQWTFFAEPEQSNLLTETGSQEATSMAKRFKSIFPDLFNGSKADISFGTTDAIRTAQTALNFLREMDDYKPPGLTCSMIDFPSDVSASGAINNDRCIKQFIGKFKNDTLSFHDDCDTHTNGMITLLDHKLKLKDPQRTKKIAKSVSDKLKWAKKNDQLTSEEIKTIYDVCRYDSAIKRTMSVWCRYFTDQDLKFFEYLADVQDYFESAYGHPNQAKSACPLTASLFHSFSRYVDSQAYGEPLPNYKPEAHFHFTHSEVLQRLIAAIVDLSADQEYGRDNILHHLEHGTVPKERQWQTSLFTPFSANIAFNLYECPRKPLKSGDAVYIDVGSGTSKHKIVASINEQPIVLTGCFSHVCDYNHVREKSWLSKNIPNITLDTCDLKQFCHTKYVLT